MKKKAVWILCCLLLAGFILPTSALDINYAQALQKSIYFYDANMCGPDAEEASRLEWRGDCHIWDREAKNPFSGATLDVSGGFHDCGDHVKFGQPQVYAIATLGWGYYEFKDAFVQTGQQQHMLDVLKWGCDYLLRCTELDAGGKVKFFVYMVGKGGSDHVNWIPPELQTKDMDARPLAYASAETPAQEMVGGASAALALMYLNYKDIDAAYAAKCLTYAKALYEMGRAYTGLGTGDGFYNSRDAEDDLTWAATWLYVVTGNMDYINHIDSYDAGGIYTGYLKKILSTTSNTWQNIWVHCWDSTWGGAFTKLATLFPERTDFDYWARWNLEFWTGGAAKHEASGDNNYLEPTGAGYAMINTWGSARYNTAAQLCMLVYNKYKPGKGAALVNWARGQMEYILGANPMGYSYLVGYPTPEESAKHPHHRAAHGSQTNDMNVPANHRHVLWGALVGGPDGSDNHKDLTTDFVYNEVGVDYNAAIVGALAGQYLLWGTGDQPLAGFPPPEGTVTEYFIEGKVDQENSQRSQVTLRVHNESVHPPHYQPDISCRYYFNISELLTAGQDISAVTETVMYDELSIGGKAAVVKRGPIAFNAAQGIYFMEYTWAFAGWYGDLELLFSLVAKQDANYKENWNAANDYSRQGLTAGYSITKNVPVYVEGRLVFGAEPPGGTNPTPTLTRTPSPTPTRTGSQIPTRTSTSSCPLLGDVNSDGTVSIVDALIIAQYYVGILIPMPGINCADVNCDGSATIVDALIIAQYYVGLRTSFPC